MSLGLTSQAECKNCPPGYFCKDHTVLPQRCPVGTYMPSESAFMADQSTAGTSNSSSACITCQAGYYCPTEGLTAMLTCPAGTYSPIHSDRCFDCRAGHLCPSPATTDTTYATALCSAGVMCPGNTTAAQTCAEGYYCPGGTWEAQECPVGTYGPTPGIGALSNCVQAPGGYYTDVRASVSRQKNAGLCEFGHECPAGSHSSKQ